MAYCYSSVQLQRKRRSTFRLFPWKPDKGATAVFTSAGIADSKKGVETDAIKSLIYTLFFQGVEGVNDGKPLVSKPNEAYTNTFFNNQARYTPYVVSVEESDKSTKVGGRFQGTMRITLRLRQLINDVRKNTHYDAMLAETPKTRLPKPTIIVVPYKKKGRVSSQNWKMTAITASPWEPCRKGSNLVTSKPLICKDGLTP